MFDFPASPAIGQVYAPASGPSWSWDGTAWKTFQTTGEMQIVRTFIPGNQSAAQVYGYYKPENLRYLEFEGVAAGGSAGPAIATGASVSSFGSGGGGGAWGKKLFPAASLPASVTITIGVPGAGVSNGNGQDGAATTFGSLVTLPGGKAGLQGANTAYSTWGAIAGSGWTAMPTGCDVAKAGQGSEGVSVNHAMGSPAGNLSCYAGRPGSSPWGEAIYGGFTSNQNSIGGSGYGWGSGATICTGSQSLRSSTTGGPGAVLLTEYIAVSGDANEVTATRERNILINGSCQISQEYGLVESTGSGYYMADQWLAANSGLGTVAGGQGWEAATARFFVYARNNAAQASVAAAAYIMCNHYVEGLDLGALKWGTSVATPAVLQFKAKAVVAGTYCVALRDWSGSYSFVYDFALAAGVWTTITVPIPIPYGGTWNLGSGVGGMFITVAHTVGSNYVAPQSKAWNSGNYFGAASMGNNALTANNSLWVTDVALYPNPGGSGIAPSYVTPAYSEELRRCQRYWAQAISSQPIIAGYAGAGGGFYGQFNFPTAMRVAPTISFGSIAYANASGLGSVAPGLAGFRCGASATAAGGAYVTFNWYANARM